MVQRMAQQSDRRRPPPAPPAPPPRVDLFGSVETAQGQMFYLATREAATDNPIIDVLFEYPNVAFVLPMLKPDLTFLLERWDAGDSIINLSDMNHRLQSLNVEDLFRIAYQSCPEYVPSGDGRSIDIVTIDQADGPEVKLEIATTLREYWTLKNLIDGPDCPLVSLTDVSGMRHTVSAADVSGMRHTVSAADILSIKTDQDGRGSTYKDELDEEIDSDLDEWVDYGDLFDTEIGNEAIPSFTYFNDAGEAITLPNGPPTWIMHGEDRPEPIDPDSPWVSYFHGIYG